MMVDISGKEVRYMGIKEEAKKSGKKLKEEMSTEATKKAAAKKEDILKSAKGKFTGKK